MVTIINVSEDIFLLIIIVIYNIILADPAHFVERKKLQLLQKL